MKKKLVDKNFSKAAAGTFALNKNEAIHGWYSYLEGYSSPLIESIIHDIGVDNIHSIFDPFCGTGTTSLVASSYGIKSYYCETNPFMQLVIEAKINCVKRLRDSSIRGSLLKEFLRRIKNYPLPGQRLLKLPLVQHKSRTLSSARLISRTHQSPMQRWFPLTLERSKQVLWMLEM